MSGPATIEAAFRGELGAFTLDAAFSTPATGITGLFGPSGSGKTSVLRAIAGLLQVAGGRFSIGGDVWQDERGFRPAYRRPVGYVFQEASLFPHLDVLGNLLYGTRGDRPAPPKNAIAYDAVIGLLGLGPLLQRSVANLSGGERQRIAIGRALLAQPRLLLMDEPLSALDQETRSEIVPFLERLHGELALPVIYVSHEPREMERLADHLVLMRGGRVIATGPLSALQSDLGLSLARDRDAAVTLETVVLGYDAEHGIARLDAEGGTFLVPMPAVPPGAHRRLIVAAGQVSLALEMPRATTVLNVLPARIAATAAVGDNEMVCTLRLGEDGAGATLLARITRFSSERLGLTDGMFVYAQVKSVALA